jgi:hypothetical protein
MSSSSCTYLVQATPDWQAVALRSLEQLAETTTISRFIIS